MIASNDKEYLLPGNAPHTKDSDIAQAVVIEWEEESVKNQLVPQEVHSIYKTKIELNG